MSQWVTFKNIVDFKDKIRREVDPQKRAILEKLLAQEEDKLRDTDEE